MTEGSVVVTQEDRQAALRVRKIQLGYSVKLPNDKHYLTQAFARHRLAALASLPADRAGEVAPIAMLLHCPKCGLQHIDEPDERTPDWTNPPHRSHLCHGCGCIWRPADVATVGVLAISSVGKADTWEPSEGVALSTHPAGDRMREAARDRLNAFFRQADWRKYDHPNSPFSDIAILALNASGWREGVEAAVKCAEGQLYHPHPDLSDGEQAWNDAACHIAAAIRSLTPPAAGPLPSDKSEA